ncbi:MAG TPA: hypothetical protein VF103_18520 [Polyangiaceae bacterium]
MNVRIEEPEIREPWLGPEAASPSGPTDVATVLLECIVNSRGSQQDSANADIEQAHRLLDRARQEVQNAMERADEAERHGDFWGDVSHVLGGDVASIAGVVAAVSLAVATGGAGTPAVLALVAAGLTAGAKAGQELGLDARVTAALGVLGGVAGLIAGNVTGAGSAWTTVANVATATQGAASAAGGGASIAEGEYRADAMDDRADAKGAQNRESDAWLRFDLAIDALDRASRDVQRAKERTSSIEQTKSDGAQTIILRIGAA